MPWDGSGGVLWSSLKFLPLSFLLPKCLTCFNVLKIKHYFVQNAQNIKRKLVYYFYQNLSYLQVVNDDKKKVVSVSLFFIQNIQITFLNNI